MKLKDNTVRIGNLVPEMKIGLILIELIFQKHMPIPYEITVTSGNDGTHMEGSKHYTDEAVDIRIFDVPTVCIYAIVYELKRKLDVWFDIVLESDHLHVEYDYGGE